MFYHLNKNKTLTTVTSFDSDFVKLGWVVRSENVKTLSFHLKDLLDTVSRWPHLYAPVDRES